MPAKAAKRAHAVALEAVNCTLPQRAKAARKQSDTRACQGNIPPSVNSGLESKLATVTEALGQVPGLPPFVSSMLGCMIPKSLGEPQDARHKHQHRVVDMVDLSLKRAEAMRQTEVEDAQKGLDAGTLELETLKNRMSTEEATLAEKQEVHLETMAKMAKDNVSLRDSETALLKAKDDLRKVELKVNEHLQNQSLLSRTLEFAVAPWKTGTLEPSSALEWSKQMLGLQERLKADSVVVAAKSVLAKGAAGAQTGFDAIVMDELETRIGQELRSIESDICSAKEASQEQAAVVEAADAECGHSRGEHRTSSELVAAAQACVEATTMKLAAAQQVVKESSAELSLKLGALKVAQGNLASFLRTCKVFDELQKRAAQETA